MKEFNLDTASAMEEIGTEPVKSHLIKKNKILHTLYNGFNFMLTSDFFSYKFHGILLIICFMQIEGTKI